MRRQASDACLTCSDVAVRALVVELAGRDAVVEVEGGPPGRRERVAIDLVEGVAVGDAVLCHAGVALERLA